MADELTKVVTVQVNNSEAVKRIAELRAEQEKLALSNAALADARNKGAISEKDYNLAISKNKEASKAYGKEINSLSHEVQKNIQENKAQEGSLVSLRGQLSNLNKEYDNLSRAERESARGEELLAKINKVTEEVSKAEEASGRFQRNVGNYKGSIIGAFSEMGGAGGKLGSGIKKGSDKANKALNTLKANPIVFFFGLLVGVIEQVMGAMKSSEANTQRMEAGFASLKGVTTIITKVLQGLGNIVAWVAEKIGNLADKWGLITEDMKKEGELAKRSLELEKERRRVNLENSNLEVEITEARAKANDKERYNAEQRLAFLTSAAEKERKIAENNKRIAEEELYILTEKSKLADNSAEENDKLVEAQIKVNQATIAYNNKMRELNGQIHKAATEVAKENEELAKNKELMEQFDRAFFNIEVHQEELRTLAEQYLAFFEMRQNMKDGFIEINEEEVEEERSVTEELAELEAQRREAIRKTTEERLKGMEYTSQAIGNTIAALDKLGEENKAAATLSKVLTIAQVTLDGARSVAAMLASAFNPLDPMPLVGKIATSVSAAAMIASTIATAVQTAKSVKLARGGLVSGPGTATSDSIPARLSNGESVMNARTTSMFSPLLSALNQAGGGASFRGASGQEGFAYLAEAVAQGMRQADIRVGVDEITRTNDRVARIKAIATL